MRHHHHAHTRHAASASTWDSNLITLVVVLVLATILSIALWRAMQLRRAAAASKDHQSAVSEIVEQAQGIMLGMSPNTGGAASPVRGTPHRCSFTPVRLQV